MSFPSAQSLDFDIDRYLNRIVPPSFLHRLPMPISWILGYRRHPRRQIGSLLICFWSFIGAFAGVALVGGITRVSPELQSHNAPVILSSLVAKPSLPPFHMSNSFWRSREPLQCSNTTPSSLPLLSRATLFLDIFSLPLSVCPSLSSSLSSPVSSPSGGLRAL
jgi:hypothetical protein